MSDTTENHALGDRPHLDERPTYEPRARQEWFIVTRLAQAIPEAIRAHAPSHKNMRAYSALVRPSRTSVALSTDRFIVIVSLMVCIVRVHRPFSSTSDFIDS